MGLVSGVLRQLALSRKEAANLPALEELKAIVATQCNKRKVIEELLQKAKEVGLTITIKSRGGR